MVVGRTGLFLKYKQKNFVSGYEEVICITLMLPLKTIIMLHKIKNKSGCLEALQNYQSSQDSSKQSRLYRESKLIAVSPMFTASFLS